MNPALTIILSLLIVLILIGMWTAFVGAACTKDAQCPAGYACTEGKCRPAKHGSFTVGPRQPGR